VAIVWLGGWANVVKSGSFAPALKMGAGAAPFRQKQMKTCWAYQAIAGCRSAWVPCVRMAEDGSRFCSTHARAIEGAMLGALMHAEARNGSAGAVEDLGAAEFVHAGI
jgi:hypothetical protein